MESYTLNEILDVWEKDEQDFHDFEEKWYKTWREWRIDKMNTHWVKIGKWYKKEIKSECVFGFRVWAFPKIFQFFKIFLNWDWNNYLNIDETKIKRYEEIYTINKEKIDSIIANFPREVNFIAWERYWEYILTEWHHRAIAIARILKNWWNLDENVKLNLYYHPVLEKQQVKNIDFLDFNDYE